MTNKSEFHAITSNLLRTQEKSCVQGTIDFGLAFYWLKNSPKIFEPITKHNNSNQVITFNSHLKIALSMPNLLYYLVDSAIHPLNNGSLTGSVVTRPCIVVISPEVV